MPGASHFEAHRSPPGPLPARDVGVCAVGLAQPSEDRRMPFDARNLGALVASDANTLWFYTTPDTRSTVLAPGYFANAFDRLDPGNVILCQTADALAWLTVRGNGTIGSGLVIDATSPPLLLNTASAAAFAFAQSAAAA